MSIGQWLTKARIIKAEVTSAKDVSEQDIAGLEKTLSEATGKKVRVTLTVIRL